jgi:hypothetical protein
VPERDEYFRLVIRTFRPDMSLAGPGPYIDLSRPQ